MLGVIVRGEQRLYAHLAVEPERLEKARRSGEGLRLLLFLRDEQVGQSEGLRAASLSGREIVIALDILLVDRGHAVIDDDRVVVSIVFPLEACRKLSAGLEGMDVGLVRRLPVAARQPHRRAVADGDLDVIGGGPQSVGMGFRQ